MNERPANSFERKTFTTSRLAEFATENELTKQIGHPASLWPIVVVKELVDNALDAAEKAGTAPDITVTVNSDSIVVADNGPGIPAATVRKLANFEFEDLFKRRLCGADARPAGQRAAKHPADGLRPRW